AKVPDARLVLASLWRRVLEQVRRLEWYPLIDPESSRDFDRSWHRLPLAPLFKGEVRGRLWRLRDVSERVIAPPGEVEPAGALRLVEALYRLTWSVTADLDDELEWPAAPGAPVRCHDGHTPTGGRWWYGAATEHAELPMGVPWPTVDWPALFDWENTRRTWNQLAPLAIARAGAEARSTPTAVADALCLDFMVACAESIARRDPLVPAEGPPRDETLRRALGRRTLEERRGRRWEAYRQWRRDAPLLAAPESGVSAEFADALLAANARRDGLPPTPPERLREARLERLREALPPDEPKAKGKRDEAARRLAREFDELAGADHPWVALVERG
ncbi:MAG TPA: hypothetical protein VFS00_20245, partial [Polyangiaceae bacterium]|nr:hypothetical protein [Polyangiaceae bacterium]